MAWTDWIINGIVISVGLLLMAVPDPIPIADEIAIAIGVGYIVLGADRLGLPTPVDAVKSAAGVVDRW